MSNRHRSGFSLIELLVVIAIIGLLSSLVLVAITSVRQKAHDAQVKSNLRQIRLLAEVHSSSNDSVYTGFDDCIMGSINCQGGVAGAVQSLIADTAQANQSAAIVTHVSDVPNVVGRDFCVATTLSSNDHVHCVDTLGSTISGPVSECAENGRCYLTCHQNPYC